MTDSEPKPLRSALALLSEVKTLVGELHPGRPLDGISLDSSLDKDLGLDSLGRVELLSRMERRFDFIAPERLFAEAETPRDLLRALSQAGTAAARVGMMEVEQIALGGSGGVPVEAQTLNQVLEWHVQANPERPHIRFYSDDEEGLTLTYAQLQEKAVRVAAGLEQAGVQKGQAVAIMLPTGPDYFYSFTGILLAGGIPVPIYPPPRMALLEEHLKRYVSILSNCQAQVMITASEGLSQARMLTSLVPSLSRVTTVDELSEAPCAYSMPQVFAQDIAFLQYTSGSTGNPKGVVLTHANLLANIRAMGEAVKASSDDVFVSWLPLYHDMGLIGAWLGSLYHAMPLVVMPPLSFISRPIRWLQAIHRYRGTLSASPNFGYETCLRRLEDKDIEGLDLSSWRIAFNGAEAVLPETVERFTERFAAYGFDPKAMMPVYGLAESSVGLAFPPLNRGYAIDRIRRDSFSRLGHAVPADPTDANALRFVACGLPLPAHQIRIVDNAGRELPERRQGRIEFRGPSSTSGYYRNAEKTRELFRGEWLDSGDLGYTVGGELYVTGRIKDLIIRAGRNIFPHEVEQAVGEIEGIRKGCVAVFGGVDAGSGTERLIVLAETRKLDPARTEALRGEVNNVVTSLLGEPADDIVLSPPGTVLKTSSGKIRRSAIRELYERGGLGRSRHAALKPMLEILTEGLITGYRRGWRKTKEFLFAGLGWGVFYLLAPIVWVGVMYLPNLEARWKLMRTCIRLLRRATATPLAIRGLENLPKQGEPCVLVCNHASYLDAYVLIAALPHPVGFVAKAELGRDKLLGEALRRIGTEFVERFETEKVVGDAGRLVETLKQGRTLVYFAEGTFTRRPGLLAFHLGAFAAACEADVPVIPIAMRGTRSMLRADSWFPRPGLIGLDIGKPLVTSVIKEECQGDHWKTAIKLRDLTRAHILRHIGEPDLGQDKT